MGNSQEHTNGINKCTPKFFTELRFGGAPELNKIENKLINTGRGYQHLRKRKRGLSGVFHLRAGERCGTAEERNSQERDHRFQDLSLWRRSNYCYR